MAVALGAVNHGGTWNNDTVLINPEKESLQLILDLNGVREYDFELLQAGYGEPGERCGEFIVISCIKKDHIARRGVSHNCRLRQCPKCVNKWAVAEARIAVHRLFYGKDLYKWRLPPRHVIVSPPAWFFGDVPHGTPGPCRGPRTFQELDALYHGAQTVLKIMAGHGLKETKFHITSSKREGTKVTSTTLTTKAMHGGCLIFHEKRYDEYDEDWRIGSHFHAFCFGAIDNERLPLGWVVKTIRKEQRNYVGSIKYQLDHSSFVKDRHVIRWFGKWSYSKFAALEDDTFRRGSDTAYLCPVCNDIMKEETRLGHGIKRYTTLKKFFSQRELSMLEKGYVIRLDANGEVLEVQDFDGEVLEVQDFDNIQDVQGVSDAQDAMEGNEIVGILDAFKPCDTCGSKAQYKLKVGIWLKACCENCLPSYGVNKP